MVTTQELVARLPDDMDIVPMPTVRRIIDQHVMPWSEDQARYVIRSGALRPAGKPPVPPTGGHARRPRRGRGYAVSRDQAVLVLVAAVLAAAARTDIVAMIRAIRASGLPPEAFAPRDVQGGGPRT